jgi:5-oxoprolinase (ATP-hydrolysing)
MKKWQFFADRGGTFTDLVAISPEGQVITYKLLSENPEQYADAVIQGIRDILKIAPNDLIPSEKIEVLKMGTTVATNALLERKGEPLVLLITKGFKDALRISYQNRPDIFARQIILPSMLYQKVVEVEERYDVNGQELIPLNLGKIKQDLTTIYQTGIRSCAIVFIHSYRYPNHENQVAEIAREIGFTQVSVSHQVSPLIKFISRGDTTVVDAYLSPILKRYVNQVSNQLPGVKIMFMKSDGGLTAADQFTGKDSILSGPAGGIVGAVKTSLKANFPQIITFDMGGTSTDVAHFKGEYEREFETEIAGVKMRAPMMSIHTVAAGGGSILYYKNGSFQVGPDSAGANPGPACYRRGGPLTITDANVMLGKIRPEYFPYIFGVDNNLSLDTEVVKVKFSQIAEEILRLTGQKKTVEEVASGFLQIAIANMANALKKVSLQRGYDVTNYTLTSFGGAGGQVCCLIADKLGIKTIFLHPYAGVLSAYGMGLADMGVISERAIEKILTDETIQELITIAQPLETKTKHKLQSSDEIKVSKIIRKIKVKYEGSNTSLLIDLINDKAIIRKHFEIEHQKLYGFIQPQKHLVIESVLLEIIALVNTIEEKIINRTRAENQTLKPVEIASIFTNNSWHQTSIFQRDDLQPEDIIIGPAIIAEKISTIVIEPHWQAKLTPENYLILTK